MRPEPTMKSVVQTRYGWRAPLGERRYARRKEEDDMPTKAWRWVRDTFVRFVNARLALEADGRVRMDGSVRELSVYERPY